MRRKPPQNDETDALVEELLEELRNENAVVDQIEDKIQRHKKTLRSRMIGGAVFVLIVILAALVFLNVQTYHTTSLLKTYAIEDAGSSNYRAFAGGILKYNRNGVAFMNTKGKETWNESGQFQNPVYAFCKETAVVADQGGNSILIFDKNGALGEITTTQPIQKVVVSAQGIVGTILKNDTTPTVVCYDTAGNLLVEHKASMNETGYPVDIAISEDGYMLLISYILVADGKVNGKVIYYNFGNVGQDETDHAVAQTDFPNEIAGSTFFMDPGTSVVVGESQIQIYTGEKEPKVNQTIKVSGEMEMVFHNEKYFGMIVKESGSTKKQLLVYTKSGRKRLEKEVNGDYSNVVLSKNQILMYSGSKCCIISMLGIEKFEGDLGLDALLVVPEFGINKYAVMNNGGITTVRLVK